PETVSAWVTYSESVCSNPAFERADLPSGPSTGGSEGGISQYTTRLPTVKVASPVSRRCQKSVGPANCCLLLARNMVKQTCDDSLFGLRASLSVCSTSMLDHC